MNFNSFDSYLREEIDRIQKSCYMLVDSLREGRIDKDTALALLDNQKSSAISTFNLRCELYQSAKLDYSRVEYAKQDFINGLDNTVYQIINPVQVDDSETRAGLLL